MWKGWWRTLAGGGPLSVTSCETAPGGDAGRKEAKSQASREGRKEGGWDGDAPGWGWDRAARSWDRAARGCAGLGRSCTGLPGVPQGRHSQGLASMSSSLDLYSETTTFSPSVTLVRLTCSFPVANL